MENQPTQLDKALKISTIVGALIVTLSLAYYLVIFLPKKEVTRIEEKNRAETMKLRDDCLSAVEREYSDYIRKKEVSEARIAKSELVPLPDRNPYDKNEAMEKCYKKYQQ